MLKINKILNKSDNKQDEQDEHKDGNESSQQALLSDKGIAEAFTDPQLTLVNKILPPKMVYKS